jgi:hypothetical protein
VARQGGSTGGDEEGKKEEDLKRNI